MITEYKTISGTGKGLYKDRGSKFYAFAFPVGSEDDIKIQLDNLRKQYHDARHHCYAWKLGIDPATTRANDDGEPSSSAGKPILNQIEKLDLTNILVVVIRYFGGTLLGVGGLINAYRSATEDCLQACKIITRPLQHTYILEFEYPSMNEVMKIVKEYELETTDHLFEVTCSIKLKVNLDAEKSILEKLGKVDSCKYKIYETE